MTNRSNSHHSRRSNKDIAIWIQHQRGYTPLHIASQEGKFEIMECLIEHRVQIDMQDNVSDQC